MDSIPVIFDDGSLPADFVITTLCLLVSVQADFKVSEVMSEDGPVEKTEEFRWIEALLTDGTDPRGRYGHDKAWQHEHLFRAPGTQRREVDEAADRILARMKASGRISLEYVKASPHWLEYDKPRGGQRQENEWVREQEDRLAGLID